MVIANWRHRTFEMAKSDDKCRCYAIPSPVTSDGCPANRAAARERRADAEIFENNSNLFVVHGMVKVHLNADQFAVNQ